MFGEANKYSAQVMKMSKEFAEHPQILYWRGKIFYYLGNEDLSKKHFQVALKFDPDMQECKNCMK